MGGLAVIIEADGGSRGNPGPAGYGAVVREAATGEVLAERLGALGTTTNNVAEYSGLIAGLTAAAELGASEVEVRMDSKLVVEQMSGRWQIKHPGLRPLAAKAAAIVARFASVRYTWIPRERNKHADALANAAMDGKSAPSAPVAPAASGAAHRSWEPPATGTPTRLLLVRHGETAFTAARRYSGRGDVPLTGRGATQAAAAAGRVGGLAAAFDGALGAVVASPLRRCRQTASAVADALGGVDVMVDDDLVECDFGDWEGLTFADVRERYAAEQSAWLGSITVAPPGGESLLAVADRTARAMVRLREAYPGRLVVVVSHVSPIKLALRDALSAGDAFLHRCHLDPGGLSIVDSWADGGVAVRAVNETAHLPPA